MTDWPAALADALFPALRPGRPVLLGCTEQALAQAADFVGANRDPTAALVADVQSRGGLPGAVRAMEQWRRNPVPRPAPPHLPALALLVLAASRMGEEDASANAYYARLGDLVGPRDRDGHPPYAGMAELCADGFDALADWLARDEHGARGQLHRVDPRAARRHVGMPIGHAVLRAADVRWLGIFFAERRRHLDAGWDPAGTLLHHPARHQITGPARELLNDPARRPLLSAALHAALAAWDGSRADPDSRRVIAATLHAQLDVFGGQLHLSLRCDGLTADERGVGPDGRDVTVPAPPATLNVPLHWLAHAGDQPARALLAGRRAVHALSGPLMMFVVGEGGFEEVPIATEPVWALTCRDDVDGGDPVDVDLPAGWRLRADVPPETLPDDHRAPDPTFAAPQALSIVAGLPLGDGGWLAERAPAVAGPNDLDAPLHLDGRPFEQLRSGRAVRLRGLDGRPGVHRLTAGAERLDLHLVTTGPRADHGALAWRLDDSARLAAGPAPAGENMSLAGAFVQDGADPDPPAERPWTRATGTVWALLANGTMEAVISPDTDGWMRHVGVGAGGAWQLPAGTVWTCHGPTRTVALVDAAAPPVPATDDAARCAAFFTDARVIDGDHTSDASERWQALCEACRDAGRV